MDRGWRAGLAVAVTLTCGGGARAMDVTDVLGRMRAALEPGRDVRATVEFVVVNEHGDEIRWAGRYFRTTVPPRKRFVLDEPADLRGVSLTLRGDPTELHGVQIYLPFVRRVRDVSRDMRGVSFMGTDFNFEDLGFVELAFQQHTLVREDDVVDGRPCYRIDSVPYDSWWYGRLSRCVDKADFLPRRVDLYDRAGELFKVLSVPEVVIVGGHVTPVRMVMEVVPLGTRTAIALRDVAYDTGLDPALFEPGP